MTLLYHVVYLWLPVAVTALSVRRTDETCVLPVLQPQQVFGHSPSTRPQELGKISTDRYDECIVQCCSQTKGLCNALTFTAPTSRNGKTENNCVMYHCHHIRGCQIPEGFGVQIFASVLPSAKKKQASTPLISTTALITTPQNSISNEKPVSAEQEKTTTGLQNYTTTPANASLGTQKKPEMNATGSKNISTTFERNEAGSQSMAENKATMGLNISSTRTTVGNNTLGNVITTDNFTKDSIKPKDFKTEISNSSENTTATEENSGSTLEKSHSENEKATVVTVEPGKGNSTTEDKNETNSESTALLNKIANPGSRNILLKRGQILSRLDLPSTISSTTPSSTTTPSTTTTPPPTTTSTPIRDSTTTPTSTTTPATTTTPTTNLEDESNQRESSSGSSWSTSTRSTAVVFSTARWGQSTMSQISLRSTTRPTKQVTPSQTLTSILAQLLEKHRKDERDSWSKGEDSETALLVAALALGCFLFFVSMVVLGRRYHRGWKLRKYHMVKPYA